MGPITKNVNVNTTTATVLKRYVPSSVRFDQAQPAPIGAIHPGDQLWSRGTRNADGTAIAADGVVSGSFRSIPGTVISTDTTASTVTVKDLSTKKPVTVRISADAQMRRLDGTIATRTCHSGSRAMGAEGSGARRPRPGGQRSFKRRWEWRRATQL